MTRAIQELMESLLETVQDVTLYAWKRLWFDDNKYKFDSRDLLGVIRDWIIEFQNWWDDLPEKNNRSYLIEVEEFTEKKCKKFLEEKEIQRGNDFRSMIFDMAGSGKFGEYPYDESFTEAVEEGFNDDGTWTAKDGTTVDIANFYDSKYAKIYGAIDYKKTHRQ